MPQPSGAVRHELTRSGQNVARTTCREVVRRGDRRGEGESGEKNRNSIKTHNVMVDCNQGLLKETGGILWVGKCQNRGVGAVRAVLRFSSAVYRFRQ